MKTIFRWATFICLFLAFKVSFSQGYNFNLSLNQGNPGQYAGSDTETVGWVALTTGLETSNRWTVAQNLPFQFFFYGNPVSNFKVSLNGQISFSNPTGTPANVNTNLPSATIPDKSILCFWDEFIPSGSQTDSSKVWMKVTGNPGSRQLWIKWNHYRIGNPATTYASFAAVLEESTYKVYLVDMNHASRNITSTIGLQNNSIQAFQFGTNFFGFFSTSDGPGTADNDYYEFTPQQTDDAGILSIDTPSNPFGSGLNPVVVTLKNFAPTTLTRATISWSINGAAQTPVQWSGSLAPLGTTSVQLGNIAFLGGKNYVIDARTDSPNGALDTDTSNDDAQRSVCPMMIGTYRIGGAGADFTTVQGAINQLICAGMEGPVELVLNRGTGPFIESVVIPPIRGASALNRLTLTADTVIETIRSSNVTTIKLDGADFVTIRNLTVDNQSSSTFCASVQLVNRADFNIIEDAILTGTSNLSSFSTGISQGTFYFTSQSTPNNAFNNIYRRNQILGMKYGINLVSTTAGPDSNTLISDCFFDNFDRNAINSTFQKSLTIERCDIRTAVGTFSQGIVSNNDVDVRIVGNRFSSTNGESVSLQNLSSSFGRRSLVANNMFTRNVNNSFNDGLRMFNCNNIDIIHNSFSSVNITGANLNIFNSSNYTIINNSFASYNASGTSTVGRLVNIGSGSTPTVFNRNNFHIQPSTLNVLRISNVDYNLSTVIGAAGFNTQSRVGDPGYLNFQSDLHAITGQLANWGDSSVAIKFDIDGENRPFLPNTLHDVGCDEYNLLPNDVGVSSIISPYFNGRKNTSEELSANQSLTVRVTNFGQNSQSNIPIRFSINGVLGPVDTVPGPLAGGTSLNYTFTSTANMSAVGSYQVKAFTLLNQDGDATNDSMPERKFIQASNDPIVFPYLENFERMQLESFDTTFKVLEGANDFDYLTNGNFGRGRSNAGIGYASSGVYAMTLDRAFNTFNSNTAVNYLRLTKNLSQYDTSDMIVMDFDFMHHQQENNINNKIWVRGSDTSAWVQLADLFTLQGNSGIYRYIRGLNVSNALKAARQNYSNSTQIRFGQEGLYRSFNLQFTDGYTFDNVGLRRILRKEVTPTALISPVTNSCGDSMAVIQVRVKNNGLDTARNIPIRLEITGTWNKVIVDTIPGPIPFNDSVVFFFDTLNSYAGGFANYRVITQWSQDELNANDTLSGNIFINAIPLAPVTNPTATCFGEPAVLTASGNGDTYNWYDSFLSNTILATSDSFVTNPLFANKTFYVAGVNTTKANVGPSNNVIGPGGMLNAFVIEQQFEVFRETVIDSIAVYTASSGNVVINLKNSSGTIVKTATFFVATPFAKTYLPLNFRVTPGSYSLNAQGSNVTGLYRNTSGASNPYSIPNSLTLKVPTAGGAGFYYFFYDWRVTIIECESDRVPIFVTVNPKPIVSLGPDIDTCQAAATITLDAGNATNNFSYFWLPDSTTNQTLTTSQSGRYIAQVTNPITGCFQRDTIQVRILTRPIPNLGPDTAICGNRLVLNPKVTGGGVSYLWSPGGQTSSTLAIATSGTYTVRAQRSANCFAIDTVVAQLNPIPSVSLGNDTAFCVSGTLSANQPSLSKIWSTGDTTDQIVVQQSGNYWVKVFNPTTLCEMTDSINIIINSNPMVNLGTDSFICGRNFILKPQSPDSNWIYRWNNGSIGNQLAIRNSGLYSVQVTLPTTGCSGSDSVLLTLDTIDVFLGNDTNICSNIILSPNLNGSQYQYSWTPNFGNSPAVFVSTTGTYALTVTNTISGCRASDTIQVNFYPTPIARLGNDTALCANQFTFRNKVSNTNTQYLWSTGTSISDTQTVFTSGTTIVTAIHQLTGCSTKDTMNVTLNATPIVQLGPDSSFCGSTIITPNIPSAGNQFLWSNGNTGPQISTTTTGLFWVRVTNSSTGCIGRDTVSVQINAVPQFNLGNDTVLCSGNLTLQVSNPNSFAALWNTGSSSNSIVVPSSGTYWLQLTDTTSGCFKYDSIQVIYDTVQIFAGNDTSYCGNAVLIPQTNPSSLGYLWNGGVSNTPLTVTQSGSYVVTTRNAFTGCSATDTVQIGINALPSFSLGNDTISCGSPIIIGSNLPSSINYVWNGSVSSSTFTASATGNVWVKGTNPSTGCYNFDTIQVTMDTVTVFVGNDTTVCDSFLMVAQTNRSGYLLNWNPVAPALLSRMVTQTGSYYLQVTNPLTGCSALDSAYHVVNVTPRFNLGNDTFICGNDSLVLQPAITASGFSWSNGNPTLRNVIRATGNYWLTASNGQCGFTDSILVTVSSGVTANFISSYNGLTAFVVANSFPNARYFWDFGDGNTGTGQNTSHTYARSGYYQIQLIVTDSCDVDTIVKPLLIIAQGTSQISDSWMVYPNPANEEVWLVGNSILNGNIQLFDALGRKVQIPHLENQSTKIRITTRSLPNGIYWIKWQGEYEMKSAKIIIQH